MTAKQWRQINARFVELGVTGDGQSAKRRDVMCRILDRQVSKPDDMTEADGTLILDNLADPTGPDIVTEVLGQGAPVEEQPDPAPVIDEAQAPAEPVPSPDEIDPTTADDWPGTQEPPQDWAGDQ